MTATTTIVGICVPKSIMGRVVGDVSQFNFQFMKMFFCLPMCLCIYLVFLSVYLCNYVCLIYFCHFVCLIVSVWQLTMSPSKFWIYKSPVFLCTWYVCFCASFLFMLLFVCTFCSKVYNLSICVWTYICKMIYHSCF